MEGLGWCSFGRQPRYLKVSLTQMANTIEIIKVPMKIPPRLKIKIIKLCVLNFTMFILATLPDAV